MIFVFPNDRTRYYVKRIIGLPGDTIEIKDGDVFVNSDRLLSGSIKDTTSESTGNKKWSITDTAIKGENITFEVDDGQVFVMGDNRGRSNDSRKFGTVPLVDVVGKVRQIWYSKNEDGSPVGAGWSGSAVDSLLHYRTKVESIVVERSVSPPKAELNTTRRVRRY